jgi:hypothetical protein
MFGGEDALPELRSLSKGEAHYDSFGRHFPVARLTSKTSDVQQVRQEEYYYVRNLLLRGKLSTWKKVIIAWGKFEICRYGGCKLLRRDTERVGGKCVHLSSSVASTQGVGGGDRRGREWAMVAQLPE